MQLSLRLQHVDGIGDCLHGIRCVEWNIASVDA
jgi:hypothetical protein